MGIIQPLKPRKCWSKLLDLNPLVKKFVKSLVLKGSQVEYVNGKGPTPVYCTSNGLICGHILPNGGTREINVQMVQDHIALAQQMHSDCQTLELHLHEETMEME